MFAILVVVQLSLSIQFNLVLVFSEKNKITNLLLGEIGDYGGEVAEGMMFRTREAFKQHVAVYALNRKFRY